MNLIDDTLLVAYVDGELDPHSSADVEAALGRDPQLRERVQRLRESTALLGAAFNHVLYAPANDTAGNPATVATLPVRRRESVLGSRWPLAAAASVVALIAGGLIGAWTVETGHESGPNLAYRVDRDPVFNDAIDRTLEEERSGTTVRWENTKLGSHGAITPVRTFQTEAGVYCREFMELHTVAGVSVQERGIACRTDAGRWKTRLRLYLDDPQA